MRIVLLRDDEVIRDQTLDDGPVTIGSDAASGVHLPDLRVALEHARLVVSPSGQWLLQVSAPSGKTLVNDREPEQRRPIHNGDEIKIGKFRLKVAVDPGCDLGVAGRSSLEELARIKDFPLPPGGQARQANEPLTIPVERQRYLVRFARELGACCDVEGLLDLTLKVLRHVFKPGMAWFGVRVQPAGPLGIVEGRTRDGISNREPQALASLEYRCLERGQALLLARKRSKNQECGLAVPLEATRGRLGLLYAEGNPEEHRYQAEHLDLLLAIGSHVAYRLEDILLGAVPSKEKAPVAVPTPPAGDDVWLRGVQSELEPVGIPRWPGCQFAALKRPGLDRRSDVYDVMTMPNGVASLLVAVVEADPARAAIALAEIRATFRIGGLHADPPRTLLRELNWLANNGRGKCTLSAAHVALNPKTGAMEFCTAGPVGALILGPGGACRTLTDAKADRLGQGTPVEPGRRNDSLRQGEMLALFTPGCGTIRNADGQELGQDRFTQALGGAFGTPPGTVLEDVQQDLAGFFKDGSQPDDITVLLLYRP